MHVFGAGDAQTTFCTSGRSHISEQSHNSSVFISNNYASLVSYVLNQWLLLGKKQTP